MNNRSKQHLAIGVGLFFTVFAGITIFSRAPTFGGSKQDRELAAQREQMSRLKMQLEEAMANLMAKDAELKEAKEKLHRQKVKHKYSNNAANIERLNLLGPDPAVQEVPQYEIHGQGKHYKSLLTIPVGIKSLQSGMVDKIVRKFDFHAFSVMLFHFDDADFSVYEWYDKCVHVYAKGQMKWWFIKRFVTPQLALSYEYIFLFDDDLDVQYFDPIKYLNLMLQHELHLSSPAQKPIPGMPKTSVWQLMMQSPEVSGENPVRKTNFVECASPVVSGRAWECIWGTLQNDLSSGWGYDLLWYSECEHLLRHHTGIVDMLPVIHNSTKSAQGNSGFADRALNEQRVLQERYQTRYHQPGLEKASNKPKPRKRGTKIKRKSGDASDDRVNNIDGVAGNGDDVMSQGKER